jgi:hypothetical protein
MSRRTVSFASLILSLAIPVLAQAQDERTSDTDEEQTVAASVAAQKAHSTALAAKDEEDYREALRAVSHAQRLQPENGRYIWTRVEILEAMGEPELAYNVLVDQRVRILSEIARAKVDAAEERLASAAESGVVTAVSRPEVSETEVADADAEAQRPPSPIVGYLVTGAGSTFLATSLTLFLVARADSIQLDCSTGARETCDGVELLEGLEADEADRRKQRVSTLRFAGWVSAGAGIGLLAFGVWDLLTHQDSAASTMRVAPTIGSGSVGITVHWRL